MDLSGFDVKRVEYALGGLRRAYRSDPIGDTHGPTVICSALETRASVLRRHGRSEQVRRNFNNYVKEAQALVAIVDPNGMFSVFPGDTRDRFEVPTFVKSRLIGDRDWPCVLLPLDRLRHWGDFLRVTKNDVPFAVKDDRLVWRGLTTGAFMDGAPTRPRSSRSHVATLAPRHEEIDIGYSGIVQISDANSDIPMDIVRRRMRPEISLEAQLRSKFLLALEGNDVATGMKWMLFSNSTVLMPAPTCETWAYESFLLPFVHYVPLRHDLSDIDDVYDWCRTNPNACEEIAQNGKQFITAFLDERTEMRVCRAVISEYLSKVSFEVTFGPLERALQRMQRYLPGPARNRIVRPPFPSVG